MPVFCHEEFSQGESKGDSGRLIVRDAKEIKGSRCAVSCGMLWQTPASCEIGTDVGLLHKHCLDMPDRGSVGDSRSDQSNQGFDLGRHSLSDQSHATSSGRSV